MNGAKAPCYPTWGLSSPPNPHLSFAGQHRKKGISCSSTCVLSPPVACSLRSRSAVPPLDTSLRGASRKRAVPHSLCSWGSAVNRHHVDWDAQTNTLPVTTMTLDPLLLRVYPVSQDTRTAATVTLKSANPAGHRRSCPWSEDFAGYLRTHQWQRHRSCLLLVIYSSPAK